MADSGLPLAVNTLGPIIMNGVQAGESTDIVPAPAEWPMGTMRLPCIRGEFKNAAIASDHSNAAEEI